MNREQMEGSWRVMRGKDKEQRGRLTDDDLDVISGKHDQLIGKIQQRYGKERDQVERDVDRWLDTVEPERPETRH
jgi:uncharacterized protein YjbJ (UPF0337 family)